MSNFEDDFARGCLPTGEPLECLYGMGWWSELPEEKPAEPEPEPEPKASGGAGMNRWRAEYAVNGIWRFYRDGMELGLYEKGDVVIDALNNAESRIAELEAEKEIMKDQQREAKNILIDKNLHIDSLYEEGYKLQWRIAKLELIANELFEALTLTYSKLPEHWRKDYCPYDYHFLKVKLERAKEREE